MINISIDENSKKIGVATGKLAYNIQIHRRKPDEWEIEFYNEYTEVTDILSLVIESGEIVLKYEASSDPSEDIAICSSGGYGIGPKGKIGVAKWINPDFEDE